MTKRLKDILAGTDYSVIRGSLDTEIEGICFDSRKAKRGWMFVATEGLKTDGHHYIKDAVETGASVVLFQNDTEVSGNVTVIKTSDSNLALGLIACNFYDHPSKRIKLIGITGTNGKTTTATLLYQLFSSFGYKTGLISTVKNYVADEEIRADYTTPDALVFNDLLDRMVRAGCRYCFAEVSSHAIHQHRIEGMYFSGGIFTNLTHDHLDYHKTFSEYIKVKKRFFDHLPESAFALSNIDDQNGRIVLQNTKAKQYTYALKSFADFKTKVIEMNVSGMLLTINDLEFWTLLTGYYNAYNITAVYAVASLLGFDKVDILKNLSALKSVKGRFDTVTLNGITVIVDYAHSPDALKNILKAVNDIRAGGNIKGQSLITITGAGGDRDRSKRPLMAAIAVKESTKVILTSDNPRSEDSIQIIEEMYAGVEEQDVMKVIKITDREEAIKTAISIAREGDIVLIAGKGHEDYQEIKGIRYKFDDKEIVEKYLKLRN
jgi:UDP-N-acetylmuramoyl-L-alanyl-D-glutamate--2,6-diaminopimelate ligase